MTRAAPKRSRWDGAGLALVPLMVFVLSVALMMPRAAVPDELPLPRVDHDRLAQIRAAEQARAAQARREGLSDDARLLGTELRRFFALQARAAPLAEQAVVKTRIGVARLQLSDEELVRLFAVQQDAFLAELSRWERRERGAQEAIAEPSPELGGAYLQTLRRVGWADEQRTVLHEEEQRVLYKVMWSAGVDRSGQAPFVLDPHEERALYGLFLRAPHPPEPEMERLSAQREHAATAAARELVEREWRVASGRWRVQKIVALSQLAPEYPRHYAIGVAQAEVGDYAAASAAFRLALSEDGDGPYALRSRNFLRYCLSQM